MPSQLCLIFTLWHTHTHWRSYTQKTPNGKRTMLWLFLWLLLRVLFWNTVVFGDVPHTPGGPHCPMMLTRYVCDIQNTDTHTRTHTHTHADNNNRFTANYAKHISMRARLCLSGALMLMGIINFEKILLHACWRRASLIMFMLAGGFRESMGGQCVCVCVNMHVTATTTTTAACRLLCFFCFLFKYGVRGYDTDTLWYTRLSCLCMMRTVFDGAESTNQR